MRNIVRLFTGLLLVISTVTFAKQVDEQTAKQVGQVFLSGTSGTKIQKSLDNLELVYRADGTSQGEKHQKAGQTTYFYVFNSVNSFVIVAGDDNVIPILGYSNDGTFDPNNIPPNTQKWFEGYKNEIRYAIDNNISATVKIQREWNDYYNNVPRKVHKAGSVAPLLSTKWAQGSPYNALCPMRGGTRTVTGCVATAMAQVMKYWNYPTTGTGTNTYTHTTGTHTVNFGTTTYQWDSMPNTLSSSSRQGQKDAVATLMYHCGVGVEMDYNTSANGGSGAYTNGMYGDGSHPSAVYALKTFFGYKTSLKSISKPSGVPQWWIDTLKNELNAGRPILYAGNGSDGGHAFVCDGYDESNYFHFNWGWGGTGPDGYYALNALNPPVLGDGGGSGGFNNNQRAIIGIEPPQGEIIDSIKLRISSFLNMSAIFQYVNDTISLKTTITNYDTTEFNGTLGVAIYNAMDMLVCVLDTIPVSLPGDTSSIAVTFKKAGGAPFFPGNYTAYVSYKAIDEDWAIAGDGGRYMPNKKEFRVVCSDSLETRSAFTITQGSLVTGKSVSIKVEVINYAKSSAFSGKLRLSLCKLDGTHVQNMQIVTTNLPGGVLKYDSDYDYYYWSYTYGIYTFTNTIMAKPGTYLVCLEYQKDGGDTTVWKFVGSTTYNNPMFAVIKGASDVYEQNDNCNNAYKFNASFSGNKATVKTTGSNFHVETDQDYYKIDLPKEFDYTIIAKLHDSKNNSSAYSANGIFSYSIDTCNTWSESYGEIMPDSITIVNGGSIYFHAEPYSSEEIGTYLLEISINRTPTVGITTITNNELRIFPNPTNGQLTINNEQLTIKNVEIFDVVGKKQQAESRKQNGEIIVDISHLSAGLYFLKVNNKTYKIIKQ